MRSRVGFVSLAVCVLALAGCGGASKSATPTATATSTLPAGSKPGEPPIPSAAYKVVLHPNGLAAKKANSSGFVEITIHGATHEICWEFSALKNFTLSARSGATIRGNLKVGVLSSPLGKGYEPSGCRLRPPILLRLLENNTKKLYVYLETPPHFERAIRGRL